MLSKPHDHWPTYFSDPFWVKYPYFLPCGVVASFAAFVFVVTTVLLKEVLLLPHLHMWDPG